MYRRHTTDSRVNWFIEKHNQDFTDSADEQKRMLEKVAKLIEKQGIKYKLIWRGDLNKEQSNNYDAELVLGGDGTLLEAASYCFSIPMAGVNSDIRGVGNKKVGSQASFSYFDRFNLDKDFHKFLEGKLPITVLDRLSARLEDMVENKTIIREPILSDVAIGPPANDSIRYVVRVKEKGFGERASADGYIIGTPQSSWPVYTYHGEILPLGEGYFQGVARGLTADRFSEKHDVIVAQKPLGIEVESLSREAVISFDGTHNNHNFGFGCKVTVSLSKHPLQIIGYGNERRLKTYAVHREPKIINLSSGQNHNLIINQ